VILPVAFSSVYPDPHLFVTFVSVGFAIMVVFLLVFQVSVPPFSSDEDFPLALVYPAFAGVHALMVTVVAAVPVSLPQLGVVVAPAVPDKPTATALGTANAETKAITTGSLRITFLPYSYLGGERFASDRVSYPKSTLVNLQISAAHEDIIGVLAGRSVDLHPCRLQTGKALSTFTTQGPAGSSRSAF
jgi:hypothetical protein